MAEPPRPPRPIKRATNVQDRAVRGRALKPANVMNETQRHVQVVFGRNWLAEQT